MSDPSFYDEVNRQDGTDTGNGHARKYKFQLIRSKNIRLDTSPRWLIYDVLPRDGLTLVWGPPKCGKSFWAFDAMMHVARNKDYRGRRVEPGLVIYIALEGERGLAARNAAYRQSHLSEDEDPPFYVLTTRLNLQEQVDELILDIRAQIPTDIPIMAIVLDTLNRSIGGSESKDEDMSRYVDGADKIREKFKSAIIIVHHCGVDATRPRGHTSLTGAVDGQIAIKRDAADKIITNVEWLKDGAEGDTFASRLEAVEVGTDDNGEPITSCIVVEADGGTSATQRKAPLPPAAKIALKQLNNAIIAEGQPVPSGSGAPSGRYGIKVDLWRRYAYQGGISEGESETANRNAFNRARQKLIAEEIVGTWGEWAWLP